MWYFLFEVSPLPNSNLEKEAGGAYVNCWIDFREQEGAEHLAQFYLSKEGWKHEETQEAKWVEKADYDDDHEGMQHFLEAEADSGCFVINQWSVNGEDD